MKKILYGLTLCILGFGLFACGAPVDANQGNLDTNTSGTGSTGGSGGTATTDGIQKKTIQQAFAEVVPVLHAPYEKGSLFFMLFTGDTATNETKNGDASQIGAGTEKGSGTWTVKAGKHPKPEANNTGKDNSILYTYTKYQPKGSDINITGTMARMYRASDVADNGAGGATIGITDMAANAPDIIETLSIDGAYKAKLTFTYTTSGSHSNIGSDNYDTLLIPTFTVPSGANAAQAAKWSKIEFTYDGNTIRLDEKQLKTLLHVAT